MKKLMNTMIPVLMFIIFSGCAVGRKISYENKEVNPDYQISRTVVALFQDKRPQVLAGSEKPSWCGHMNSTAQIPYNMQTESGKPLAEEFTHSIVGSFTKRGINAIPMMVDMRTTYDSILKAFSSGDRERLLYFTIKKWESSASPRFSDIHYEVIYDLDLEVYDKAGKLLASGNVHDNFNKNQDMAVNLKRLQAMADEVFITQVRALLNKEGVMSSLK